ncbi:MAG: DUF2339 domain-containing protein, partial [Vallitaleaceae bacterium]|nr:DUF2339 domain-containing protein [Vallitaleaceae bacterium]
ILFMIYINHISLGKKGDLWPRMPLLFLLAGILFLGYYRTNKLIYKKLSIVVAILDGAYMAFIGYSVIALEHSMLESLLHMALMLAVIVFIMYKKRLVNPHANLEISKALGYVFVNIGLSSIIGSSEIEHKWILLFILLSLLQFALYYVKFDDTKKLRMLMRTFEFMIVNSSMFLIAQATYSSMEMFLVWILTIAIIALILIRILSYTGEESTRYTQLWTGIRFTLLVLAIMEGRTQFLEYAYVFSLVCMLSALLSIFIGIWRKAKVLRLYGLATTLLCVLKMVTLDVDGLQTMLRVGVFIIGGIICFLISALYSRFVHND